MRIKITKYLKFKQMALVLWSNIEGAILIFIAQTEKRLKKIKKWLLTAQKTWLTIYLTYKIIRLYNLWTSSLSGDVAEYAVWNYLTGEEESQRKSEETENQIFHTRLSASLRKKNRCLTEVAGYFDSFIDNAGRLCLYRYRRRSSEMISIAWPVRERLVMRLDWLKNLRTLLSSIQCDIDLRDQL